MADRHPSLSERTEWRVRYAGCLVYEPCLSLAEAEAAVEMLNETGTSNPMIQSRVVTPWEDISDGA